MTNDEKIVSMSLEKIQQRRAKRRRNRKIKRIIAAFTSLAVCLTVSGFVYSSYLKEVSITEIDEFNGTYETKTIRTRAENVTKLLEKNGVTVSDTDRVNVPIDAPVNDKEDIVITRGKNMTIKANGGEKTVTVTKADPKEALVEAGFVPDEADQISSDGNSIELTTIDEEEEIINEVIPHETVYEDDADLEIGTESVRTEGYDGNLEKKFKVVYQNDAEVSRELVSETVTVEAVNTVIARGTKPTPTPTEPPKPAKASQTRSSGSESSSDSGANSYRPSGFASGSNGTIDGHSYSKKITMTATAYSTSAHENGGYTVSAVGNPLRYGIVAVDPNVIPLGSTVYVTSADGSWTYGIASAEDTGGAIKGNRIDLCYESESETRVFGRQSCIVYVLVD